MQRLFCIFITITELKVLFLEVLLHPTKSPKQKYMHFTPLDIDMYGKKQIITQSIEALLVGQYWLSQIYHLSSMFSDIGIKCLIFIFEKICSRKIQLLISK